LNLRFRKHFAEGDQPETIVSECADNKDSDVDNIVDLSGISNERSNIFDKDDEIENVCYIIKGQTSSQ